MNSNTKTVVTTIVVALIGLVVVFIGYQLPRMNLFGKPGKGAFPLFGRKSSTNGNIPVGSPNSSSGPINMASAGICLGVYVCVLVALYKTKTWPYEGYQRCLCTGGGQGRDRVCQESEDSEDMYDNGQATEYSNFPNKGWSTSSPGDSDYPPAKYCHLGACGDNVTGWVAWDYQDL
jgi:hypothetical protein